MNLRGRRLELALAGGVALLAGLVYANSLANGFAYDDFWLVETRDLVHGLGRLPELLAVEYWPGRFHSGLYRPVTLFSFAVDWQIWGGRPFGFHLTNLLIHASVSALLSLLLLRLFHWWASLAGGAIFAVHPVHTEAVANVVGRSELLAALFVLLACLVYVGAVRRGRIALSAILVIGLLYALALLSKEVGAVLPGLLLLTDLRLVGKGQPGGWRTYLRSRVPLIAALTAVLILCMGLRWAVLGAALESVPDRAFVPDASFTTRLLTMARVWPRYYELLFFPTALSADYSPAVILPASRLTTLGIGGLLAVGGTVAFALAVLRKVPEVSLAVGWAALSLLPVSNLILVAEIVLAERTLYLPSMAVSIIAALLLARARPSMRAWLGTALALWVAGFSVVTVRRNPVWMSTDAVFESLLEHHPESSRLLWWLGERQVRRGDWEGAREWYRRSLEVWPYHAPYLAEFAVLLKDHDELEEAETMATLAVELDPDYPDYYSLLALIRLQRGDHTGVLDATRRGAERVGRQPVFYALRVDAFARLGDDRRAAAAQDTFVSLRGGQAIGRDWYRLAELSAAAGDTVSALAALEALRQAPDRDPARADSLERALRGLP